MKLKQTVTLFLSIVMLAFLFTSCGSKTKHTVTETGRSSLEEGDFITYSVDNEYSILIPSIMKNKPNDPDRFSAEFQYNENDCDGTNFSYEGALIFIDSDTKESFENRRKEQGNLAEYPFTLKGFSDIGLSAMKEDTTFRMIHQEELMINNMPAIIDVNDMVTNVIILGDVEMRRIIISLQASNGKLYRIQYLLYPSDELSDEIPEWITASYNSFKLL